MSWCNNPREHREEGRRDYERYGRGDWDKMHSWNDCDQEYQRGVRNAQYAEEERRTEQEIEERRERQREREREYRRQLEQEAWEREQEMLNQEQYEEGEHV